MENRGKSIASMALGIASLVLCESIVGGIVCAIIGLVLSKQAIAQGGENGFNKAGKITSTIGLILGCVCVAIYLGCAICSCAIGGAGLVDALYNY